jgi:hypothetical protein
MGEVKQIMKVEFDLEELEAIIDKKIKENNKLRCYLDVVVKIRKTMKRIL